MMFGRRMIVVGVLASFILVAVVAVPSAIGQGEGSAGIPIIPIGPCFGGDDPLEDNDLPGLGRNIELPFSYEGLRSCDSDPDWFRFSAPRGAKINVQVDFDHAQGDLDLELHDDHMQLALSNSVTDDEAISYTAPVSGVYAVGVYIVQDPDAFGNTYNLDIDVSCPMADELGGAFRDGLLEPMSIPDAGAELAPMSNCFQIESSLNIQELAIGLEIRHNRISDLIVSLEHDDTGTAVVLMERPSPAGMDCIWADIDVEFSDGGTDIEDQCSQMEPAFSGVVRPVEALSMFEGETLGGTWRIRIADHATESSGIVPSEGHAGLNMATLDEWYILPVGERATPTPELPTDTATPTDAEDPTHTPTDGPTDTPTPPVAGLAGDVDCNGFVNAIDAAFILQRQAGLVAALPCPENADVNEDGNTSSVDAAVILQFTAGLIPGLPT